MSTTEEIRELGAIWAKAEEAGDVAMLGVLADNDFRLVGPFGFVLDKDQWLERYRSGDLVTSTLTWDEVAIADHGDVAIAIGKQTQEATFGGRPADGAFRVTHVFSRADDGWHLLGMHLSQAAPPNGRP